MKLTNKKLALLREHVLSKGAFDEPAVAELLGIPEDSDFKAISNQLRETYPDDFGAVVPDEDEDGNEDPEVSPQYQLVDENHILHNLEVVKVKDNRVILRTVRPPEPEDRVTFIVKGETVTVDLIRLRKLNPADVRYGVSVARLIELAELAKG